MGYPTSVLLPLRITHSGSQPLKRIGEAIPLGFSGESPFRAPNGAGSLAVGKRSGCVFQPQGRRISRLRDAVSIRERTLTAEEPDRLSNACETPTERLVAWTLLDTGLRVGELCDLTPKKPLWQQCLAAKSTMRSRGSSDRINSQGLLTKGYFRRRIASQAGPPRDSSSERSPLMDALLEKLDTKLREWGPEIAEQVRRQIAEMIDLADRDLLDLVRSRSVEQEVVDLIDEPAPR
jgi:hypothetical protein